MQKICFCIFLLFLFLCISFSQSDPTNQAVNTWQFQYQKAELGDVTHPYENGFVWDFRNDKGVVFGGHLGTYYTQPENDLVEIMNTNMTYVFSFDDFKFHKVYPMDRPPKR